MYHFYARAQSKPVTDAIKIAIFISNMERLGICNKNPLPDLGLLPMEFFSMLF